MMIGGRTNPEHHHPALERDSILAFLMSHKKKLIAAGFRRHGRRINWWSTKSRIRAAIEMLIDSGKISLEIVFLILLEIEGWGRQRIYLYKFTGGEALRERWLDGDKVKSEFESAGLGYIYNSTRSLADTKGRQLFAVRHDSENGTIRYIWTEHRTTTSWDKSIPDKPLSEFSMTPSAAKMERLILRTYREAIVRSISAFEWNIETGEAMVSIRKIGRTKYPLERTKIVSEVDKVLPMSDFQPLSISKLINNLDDIPDVIREKISDRALNDADTKIRYETGYMKDLSANSLIRDRRESAKPGFTGDGGFTRWKIGHHTYIGVELYAQRGNDHHIGISSQQLEEDVKHVLQRIRPYCE